MEHGLIRFVKGSGERLDGRLVVYARVTGAVPENLPMSSMVHNGLLVVQGNYRDQRTMADFFREEFGLSLEKGIEEIIDQARAQGGLEGALDPDAVRERLAAMSESEFLPIPARVISIRAEDELEGFEGDVVSLGAYEDLQHAHMAVNAFPILYQSRYREQERGDLHEQIEKMLSVISQPSPIPDEPTVETYVGDLENHLLRDLLPEVLYAHENSAEALVAEGRFRRFMAPYFQPEDVESMMGLVPGVRSGDAHARHRLELLVGKVAALQREDYRRLEEIKRELGES